MIYYIKSEYDDNILLLELKRYISINKKYIVINNKLKKVLKDNYKTDINTIIDYLYKNIRIKNIEEDIHQIYILDEPITNKLTLNEALQLIEYGDVDIQPEKVVTRLLNISITQTKNDLGGL